MKQYVPGSIFIPQPVFIIGTYDEGGKPNAMNAAWCGQVSPKNIGIALSSHKSTDNIKLNMEFTVSFATEGTAEASDFVGIASGNKDPEKMAKTGWTCTKAPHVNAPYFEEFPVYLECKVVEIKQEYGENIIIAEIISTFADEEVLTDGKIDIDKLKPIIFDSSMLCYRTVGESIGPAWGIGKKLM
ncbi:MAG: flavin reductase family protein [Lachnospiraceae bacterium]|nr:flavin reductase family protein [Lachnospiraceae bacterium]